MKALTADGAERDAGIAKLYGILVKFGRTEARRRGARLHLDGPELDDLAHQAAADATLAICRKVDTFRGDCRFTTWAYRFVAFDVASKISRHFWQRLSANYDEKEWGLLPASAAQAPEEQALGHDLLRVIERACAERLTARQRTVFEAVAVQGTPTGELAARLGSTPNSLYKTMFDARQKLRQVLAETGYLESSTTAG